MGTALAVLLYFCNFLIQKVNITYKNQNTENANREIERRKQNGT